MNDRVCSETLCLTAIGAVDLGKSFVFSAPEDLHFLGVFVQVENLADQPLLLADFAERTSILVSDGGGGFVTFIVGDSVLLPPISGQFDAGETTEIGLLFAVSDGSTTYRLAHEALPPIALVLADAA